MHIYMFVHISDVITSQTPHLLLIMFSHLTSESEFFQEKEKDNTEKLQANPVFVFCAQNMRRKKIKANDKQSSNNNSK